MIITDSIPIYRRPCHAVNPVLEGNDRLRMIVEKAVQVEHGFNRILGPVCKITPNMLPYNHVRLPDRIPISGCRSGLGSPATYTGR